MTRYTKPVAGQYAEYFEVYLEHLAAEDRDALVLMQEQGTQVFKGLMELSDQQASHRYVPEKWSVREVIGHLIDTERLFAFRALWIARGETNVQPGMDENLWAANSNAGARELQDLGEEYQTMRAGHLQLFSSFDQEAVNNTGLCDGVPTMVNSFPWLVAAHELHHLLVLRDRYGVDFLAG